MPHHMKDEAKLKESPGDKRCLLIPFIDSEKQNSTTNINANSETNCVFEEVMVPVKDSVHLECSSNDSISINEVCISQAWTNLESGEEVSKDYILKDEDENEKTCNEIVGLYLKNYRDDNSTTNIYDSSEINNVFEEALIPGKESINLESSSKDAISKDEVGISQARTSLESGISPDYTENEVLPEDTEQTTSNLYAAKESSVAQGDEVSTDPILNCEAPEKSCDDINGLYLKNRRNSLFITIIDSENENSTSNIIESSVTNSVFEDDMVPVKNSVNLECTSKDAISIDEACISQASANLKRGKEISKDYILKDEDEDKKTCDEINGLYLKNHRDSSFNSIVDSESKNITNINDSSETNSAFEEEIIPVKESVNLECSSKDAISKDEVCISQARTNLESGRNPDYIEIEIIPEDTVQETSNLYAAKKCVAQGDKVSTDYILKCEDEDEKTCDEIDGLYLKNDRDSIFISINIDSENENSTNTNSVFEEEIVPVKDSFNLECNSEDAITIDEACISQARTYLESGINPYYTENKILDEDVVQKTSNLYAAKKSVAQGMMDIALITANANQLRYMIEYNSTSSTFALNVGLIIISLLLQVAVGVALIFKGRMDFKGENKADHAVRINNYIVGAIFFVTMINVFIASFTITVPVILTDSVHQKGNST